MKLIAYFRRTKTRLLLVYGYVVPFVGSVIISVLPMFFGYDYSNISVYFSANIGLLLAFLAIITTITIPFQATIINEDNPHVLATLEKSKVREVFLQASVFQAIIIVLLSLIIFLLSVGQAQSSIAGFVLLFASTTIAFESIALISNGRAYGGIRERIITAVSKAEQSKTKPPNNPST